ncbi:MAG TPA: hypothetical protein VJS92_05740 [Candidatus Polarisedimenticolaceae bacterium]|nr:hypothetical protein [Candidatus Polarisedimenticolaceae bacterium]
MRRQVVPAFGLALAALAARAGAAPPDGWRLSSADPEHRRYYELSLDRTVSRQGAACARLAWKGPGPEETQASFHQAVRAEGYRGRRVRFAGWLRAEEAEFAGLWLRVDGMHAGHLAMLDYAGSAEEGPPGTLDWRRIELELDVPAAAEVLRYGASLAGPGRIWLDAVELTVLGPATGRAGDGLEVWPPDVEQRMRERMRLEPPLRRPRNLDLER